MTDIKLLLDEDVHFALSAALQNRGYDAVHVQTLSRKGQNDADQLGEAVYQERCLITFNVKDFVLLHNEYVRASKHHFGIVVSKQRPVGETLRRLLGVLGRHSPTTIANHLEFL